MVGASRPFNASANLRPWSLMLQKTKVFCPGVVFEISETACLLLILDLIEKLSPLPTSGLLDLR